MKTITLINENTIKYNLINLKNLVFEVTEKCNLQCKYCGLSEQLYESYEDRDGRDLSFNKAKILIDYLLDLWSRNRIKDTNLPFVIGFYGGEPLLKMKLIKQIINYIEQSETFGREIHYAMTTNALLLHKHMDYLIEKNFFLTISYDGDEDAQGYRIDRLGNNSFHIVSENVETLKTNYPDYFYSANVNFISVLHNKNNVGDIVTFFKDKYNKKTIITALNSRGVSEDKKNDFMDMYQNMSTSLSKARNCEEIEDQYFLEMPKGLRLSHYIYNSTGNVYYNYNQLLMQKYIVKNISTGTCTPFSKKLFMTVDGKILPCERIDYDLEMGYVRDGSVELDYKTVANMHNSALQKIEKQCISCKSNSSCPQCLYYIENIREKEPHCQSFCTSEMLSNERAENLEYLGEHPNYYEKILKEVRFTF